MERWDLYDQNRIKTGEIAVRGGAPIPPGRYHVVVHAAVFNSEGEMLIQKRQPWKEVFPGFWDITCGGSSQAGEDSPTAIWREVREEVGLDLDALRHGRAVFTVNFGNGFDDYYIAKSDTPAEDLVLQESEVAEARWAPREEILSMIGDHTFIPYHPALIELLFFHFDHGSIYEWK
ncbi:MAG: NUDIX domain-containing protein [Clostridia bacterium]|nr:NUDIX domain-containing protein [Clostridia bacterium]